MKKYWHIALMLLCVLMITSCGDDDKALEVDEVWKVQNEEAFQAQMLVPDFTKLNSQSNAGFILYKVLKTGESKEPIYYTSTVKCYYKGSFIDGTVFDDSSFEAGEPKSFVVGEMTDGFATALQNMHPGDKWLIWVPWQLGYGEAGRVNSTTGAVIVKPCTTMIFEMEVVEIEEE